MTEEEKRIVYVVFSELRKLPYSKLNTIIGSETIKEMLKIYDKLDCEDYCEKHHVRYEDMTDEDREIKALEEIEESARLSYMAYLDERY